ncbi:hypothetical protein ACSFA3_05890 [Variovorax sp. RHLX14]|uniref:hypothetical protein n=1 Tax=Variovorax sp. RHLX14 TaxID=1259731 RepID=UPI003F458AD2
MHIVVIAWLYVALMMAIAEATSTTGTVLGAVFTFVLYGVAPVALVVYLISTPARRRKLRERELAAQEAARSAARSAAVVVAVEPDAGSEAAADAVAPVRKET